MRRRSARSTALLVCLFAAVIAGCTTNQPEQPPPPMAPEVTPTLPPTFPAQDLVGRWGLAAYHREDDRARTVEAAAKQCRNPYLISPSPTGGIMMHLADQSTRSDLALKGAPGGKNFIGPHGEPPGSTEDRQVVSFDGRVLILRWMDPEVQGRYGTMVYVRCGPQGQKKKPQRSSRPKKKT
jgi:hypothetical protein